jgi:hypothetical protein
MQIVYFAPNYGTIIDGLFESACHFFLNYLLIDTIKKKYFTRNARFDSLCRFFFFENFSLN